MLDDDAEKIALDEVEGVEVAVSAASAAASATSSTSSSGSERAIEHNGGEGLLLLAQALELPLQLGGSGVAHRASIVRLAPYTKPVKRVALLGATGSIGRQAIEIVEAHPGLELCAAASGSHAARRCRRTAESRSAAT